MEAGDASSKDTKIAVSVDDEAARTETQARLSSAPRSQDAEDDRQAVPPGPSENDATGATVLDLDPTSRNAIEVVAFITRQLGSEGLSATMECELRLARAGIFTAMVQIVDARRDIERVLEVASSRLDDKDAQVVEQFKGVRTRALVQRMDLNSRLGQMNLVLADAALVLEHEPDNFDALEASGSSLFINGQTAEALAIYERLIALKPEAYNLYLGRSGMHCALGHTEEAVADARRAAERMRASRAPARDLLAARVLEVQALAAGGRLREADALVDALLEEHSRSPVPLLDELHEQLLASIKAQAAEQIVASSVNEVDQLLAVDLSNDAAGLVARATKLTKQFKRPILALADLQRAVALAPECGEYHGELGKLLYYMDREDEALAAINKALELTVADSTTMYGLRASVLHNKQQFAAAIEDWGRAISLSPNDANLWRERAGSRLSVEGDVAHVRAALSDLQQALRLDPKDMAALGMRAFVYARSGQYALAIADMTRVIDSNSLDMGRLRSLAEGSGSEWTESVQKLSSCTSLIRSLAFRYQCYLSENRVREALDDVLLCGSLELEAEAAFEHWAVAMKLYAQLEEHDKAFALLERINKRFPDNPHTMFWYGWLYGVQSEFARAVECYTKAIELGGPEQWNLNLSALFASLGDHKRAIAVLDRLSPDVKRSPDAMLAYTVAYIDGSQFNKAIASATQVIDARGQDAPSASGGDGGGGATTADPEQLVARALVLRGRAKLELGQVKAAIEDLTGSWRMCNTAICATLLAQAHATTEDYAKAVQYLSNAIRLDPADPELYIRRAAMKEYLNDIDGGLEDLERAAERMPKPQAARLHAQRASLLLQLDRPVAAIAASNQAIESDRSEPEAWRQRAAARATTGDLTGALEDVLEALRLEPDSPESTSMHATILLDLGRVEAGLRELERALRLNPTPEQHARTARIYGDLDRMADVERTLMAAVELHRTAADPLVWRARYYIDNRRFAEALKDLDAAITLLTDDERANAAAVYVLRAKVRGVECNGNWDAVLADIKCALEIEPEHVEANILRADVLAQIPDRQSEAIAQYECAFKLDQTNPSTLHSLGIAMAQSGNLVRAVELFTELLKHNDASIETHYNRGLAFAQQGRLSEALADFDVVIEHDPNSLMVRLARTQVLGQLERYSEALVDASHALTLQNDREYAEQRASLLAQRAALLGHLGRPLEGLADLDESLALDGTDLSARVVRVMLLGELERYTEALADVNAIIEREPQPDILARRSAVHTAMGNVELALADVHRALELEPTNFDALMQLANIQSELVQLAECESTLRKVLDARPNEAHALDNLGTVVALQGRLTEALEIFHQVVEHHPTYYSGHSSLGSFERIHGRWDTAIKHLDRALELNPRAVQALMERAYCKLYRQPRHSPHTDALADISAALELEPKNADALEMRALIHMIHGESEALAADTANAIDRLTGVLTRMPTSCNALWTRGRVHRWAGNLDAAVADLSRLIELCPAHALAWANRGYAYQAANRKAEAESDFAHARSLWEGGTLNRSQRAICHQIGS